MVKFEELESRIRQSGKSYSFTDDGQGKKSYTIFSDELKKSLRDIVHSTAQAGKWQINHTIGANCIKYRQEQGGEFGLYQKYLDKNIPDEFLVLSENRTSAEKEKFEADKKQFAESNQIMEEHRRQMEEHRRQIEGSRQNSSQEYRFPRSGEGAYVSYDGDANILREALGILQRESNNSVPRTQADNN